MPGPKQKVKAEVPWAAGGGGSPAGGGQPVEAGDEPGGARQHLLGLGWGIPNSVRQGSLGLWAGVLVTPPSPAVTPSAQPVARGSLAGERAISPKGQRLGEDSQPSLGAASLEERQEGRPSKAATLTSWGRVLAGVGSSTSHRRRGPSPSPQGSLLGQRQQCSAPHLPHSPPGGTGQ